MVYNVTSPFYYSFSLILSNLSLIVLVQLKRQSEFLLHHQDNLQLISICVHYLAPFGFFYVSINNKNKGRFLHVCVWFCVGIRKRVTAALFHFSQLVLATLDPVFCRLSWLLPRLISWCLMLKSWKKLKWMNPYTSSCSSWTLLLIVHTFPWHYRQHDQCQWSVR